MDKRTRKRVRHYVGTGAAVGIAAYDGAREFRKFAKRGRAEPTGLDAEQFANWLGQANNREDFHGVRVAQSNEETSALRNRAFSDRVSGNFPKEIRLPGSDMSVSKIGGRIAAYDLADGTIQYHISFKELGNDTTDSLMGEDNPLQVIKGTRGVPVPFETEGDAQATVGEIFLRHYETMRPQLEEAISEIIERHTIFAEAGEEVAVTFSGHSLGGAMSQIASAEYGARFRQAGAKVRVLNLAGPSVGNKAFAEHMAATVPDYTRLAVRGDPFTNDIDVAMGIGERVHPSNMRELVIDMNTPRVPTDGIAAHYFSSFRAAVAHALEPIGSVGYFADNNSGMQDTATWSEHAERVRGIVTSDTSNPFQGYDDAQMRQFAQETADLAGPRIPDQATLGERLSRLFPETRAVHANRGPQLADMAAEVHAEADDDPFFSEKPLDFDPAEVPHELETFLNTEHVTPEFADLRPGAPMNDLTGEPDMLMDYGPGVGAKGALPTPDLLTGEPGSTLSGARGPVPPDYATTRTSSMMRSNAMGAAGLVGFGALDAAGIYDDPTTDHYQDAGYAAKQSGIDMAKGVPVMVGFEGLRYGEAAYNASRGATLAAEGTEAAEGAEVGAEVAAGALEVGEVAGGAALAEGGLNPVMDAVAMGALVVGGGALATHLVMDELNKPKVRKQRNKQARAQREYDAEVAEYNAYVDSHPYMNYEAGAHGGIDGASQKEYVTQAEMQAFTEDYGYSDDDAQQLMSSMFDSQSGEARDNWVSYAKYTGDVDPAGNDALRDQFQSQEDYDRYMEHISADEYTAAGGSTGFGSTYAGQGYVKQLTYSEMAMYQYWLQQDPEMLYGQDYRRLEAMGLDPRLAYDQSYIAEVSASPPDVQREMMFTDDALTGNNAAGGMRTSDGNLVTYRDWTAANNADGNYANRQIAAQVKDAQHNPQNPYYAVYHAQFLADMARAHGFDTIEEYRAAQAQHRVETGENLQDVSAMQSMLAYQLQNDPNNPFADHLREELDKAKAGQHVARPGDDENTTVPPPPPGREIGQEPDQEPGTGAPPADANHPDPDNRHMSGMDRLRRDHPEFFNENGHALSPPTQEMVDFMADPQNQQTYSDGAVDPAAPPPQNPDLPDDATTDPALDPDKARHDHKTDLVEVTPEAPSTPEVPEIPDHLDEMFHKPLEKPMIPPSFDALFETQARTQPALAPVLAAPASAAGKSAGGMGQESGQRFHDDIKFGDLARDVIQIMVLQRLAATRAGA